MEKQFCDPTLTAWITSGNQEVQEIIIEVHLPPRQMRMMKRNNYQPVPVQLLAGSPDARLQRLQELNSFLAGQMQLTTTVLKAAGAIAVRATGQEVQKILQHPMVKAIRSNRRLFCPDREA